MFNLYMKYAAFVEIERPFILIIMSLTREIEEVKFWSKQKIKAIKNGGKNENEEKAKHTTDQLEMNERNTLYI
jgi:hypothetical protein